MMVIHRRRALGLAVAATTTTTRRMMRAVVRDTNNNGSRRSSSTSATRALLRAVPMRRRTTGTSAASLCGCQISTAGRMLSNDAHYCAVARDGKNGPNNIFRRRREPSSRRSLVAYYCCCSEDGSSSSSDNNNNSNNDRRSGATVVTTPSSKKTKQQKEVGTAAAAATTVIQYPAGSVAPPLHHPDGRNRDAAAAAAGSALPRLSAASARHHHDYYGKDAVAFTLRPTTTAASALWDENSCSNNGGGGGGGGHPSSQQETIELVEQQLKSSTSSCVDGSEKSSDNCDDGAHSSATAFFHRNNNGPPSLKQQQQALRDWGDRFVLRHLLPAHHPDSVARGYRRFALASFAASVAGSAGMVLSTQTLLLAVMSASSSSSNGSGMIIGAAAADDADGSSAATAAAPLLAGAWNWVVKDGMGQLGGVLVASKLSHRASQTLDADPKRWRLAAALALDGAAALEIAAPLLLVAAPDGGSSSALVLPLAVAANLLKNVGFLVASASRAALHQSLAVAGNLADVTAKAGSQGMAAGTLGTALGVGLSAVLASLSPPSVAPSTAIFHHYGAAFAGLALIHQGCHYLSLRAVALRHLNRQRLDLVVQHYVNSSSNHIPHDHSATAVAVLTPEAVAEREVFLPFLSSSSIVASDESRSSEKWLRIGSDVHTMLQGRPRDVVERMLNDASRNGYLIQVDGNGSDSGNAMSTAGATSTDRAHLPILHLTFLHRATGQDLVRGVLHCALLRKKLRAAAAAAAETTTPPPPSTNDDGRYHHSAAVQQQVEEQFPQFLQQLHAAGWTTDTNTTNIEPSRAVRLAIENTM